MSGIGCAQFGQLGGLGIDLSPESLSMDKSHNAKARRQIEVRELPGRGFRINFWQQKTSSKILSAN
jgi:hypothetical protein